MPQCFDTVGWAAGRASGAKFTNDLKTILKTILKITPVTNSQNSYDNLNINLRTKCYDHLLAVLRL